MHSLAHINSALLNIPWILMSFLAYVRMYYYYYYYILMMLRLFSDFVFGTEKKICFFQA